jgi:hypothetical protein
MLKIKDNVDLKELKKFGFKEVQQNKRINYIYMPVAECYDNQGNMITVCNDRNLFTLDRYIGEDRKIKFRLNECASFDFEKTISVLYDLIQANLVEKVEDK